MILLLGQAMGADEPWTDPGWGFGGLPAVNYNSDEGLGLGVVGSAYRYDGHTSPYKTAVNLVLFVSTKAVHTHSLEVDALELGDQPLRLTARAAFDATKTGNYCGTGPAVTCDPAVAEAAADALGLDGVARDDFVRRYYRVRFLNPNAQVNLRWAIDPMPHRVELMFGWRANAMIPGEFSDPDPFPGSLYATDFPGGEQGLVSVAQVGVMVDDRDNEPAPIRGYWVDASVRGAHAVLLSDYDYVGFNVTLRGYAPVGTDRLVFADRVMFDGMSGDAHTLELATPGGTQRFAGFYGSLNGGRGIRQRRFVGKVKVLEQAELRWTFATFGVGGTTVDLGTLGFVDLGLVATDFGHLEQLGTLLPSTGGGLRIALDQNFVVRADVGVSPIEAWSPGVYIDLRNLF
ncbi:MAG: BamA/TamA family outer membrane protein [Myxococcota bacterium]